MDLNWRFQQENAALRKENEELREEIRRLNKWRGIKGVIDELIQEEPPENRVFTDGVLEFMHVHDMNYQQVYQAYNRYGNLAKALRRVAGV